LSITGGLSELRHATKIAALALNFEADRWQDLITSVGEAAMNAAVHGGGGQGCVCADERGTVQVWIVDQGQGIEYKTCRVRRFLKATQLPEVLAMV
jgi:anti-sigma regulatory factor (Ser/Thr protein kinase)